MAATRATTHGKLVGQSERVVGERNHQVTTATSHVAVAAASASMFAEDSSAAATTFSEDGRRRHKQIASSASSASVSPSSFQSLTTDSTDSLAGIEVAQALAISSSRNNQARGGGMSPPTTASGERAGSAQPQSKSPILVKYNYYDYNGERQENHDIGSNGVNGNASGQPRVQRQLSPTFKQSLDQIVRGSQKYLAQAASTSPISPPSSKYSSNGSSALQQGNQVSSATNNNNNNNNYSHLAQNQNQALLFGAPDQHNGNQQTNWSLQNGYTMTLLARRYKLSSYEHHCLRCSKTVYQMDKVGPLKDFTFYHQNCFKCRECGTKLTLKTYFNNQHSGNDQEVYCHRHCPKTPAGKLDNQSVGIRAALNAPKVFDPTTNQTNACHQLQQQQQQFGFNLNFDGQFHHSQPQVDASAMHIQHAIGQTKFQAVYKQAQVDKNNLSQFLNRRLEYLEPKQKLLEMRHREEEEQLFKMFEERWSREESSIREQIRDEWQRELAKLLDKYKRQLASSAVGELSRAADLSSSSPPPPPGRVGDKHAHAITAAAAALSKRQQHAQQLHNHQDSQYQRQAAAFQQPRLDFHRHSATAAAPSNGAQATSTTDDEQRLIELERTNLEKTMTIKLDRKKETLKRKLREFERQATAELVEKQSREMITLISLKLEEFKQEQKVSLFAAPTLVSAQLGFATNGSCAQFALGLLMATAEARRPILICLTRIVCLLLVIVADFMWKLSAPISSNEAREQQQQKE